ncbi:MAG: sigma-54 dependent transcriptional regulator [Fimbriimonadales bacterium]|nr:sigma-54 dependent transcriptional regulator [Fimbriimonadales bacterium]
MRRQGRLLVVDDEAAIRRILEVAFTKEGFHVGSAEDAYAALRMLEEGQWDCVLTDVTMAGMSGFELFERVRARWPDTEVVIMTAYGTIPQAVDAIRKGAFEYVPKPFDLESLKRIIRSACQGGSKPVRRSPASSGRRPAFLAESPAMRAILEEIETVADSRATVLVTGESGVGKEVVAKTIHALSGRSDKPFVAVSCAALPETLLESELFGYEKGAFTGAQSGKPGRFELADGGTLFLDEIGDVPPAIQVKLLRVLQEREFERLGANRPTKVDVRLVAATNRDLREAVEQGSFRLDLLYRLQVVEICLPPLRERKEDILPLARHFMEKCARDNGRHPLEIPAETERLLLAYRWPGNVRELENVIERAVVLAKRDQTQLIPQLLPPALRSAA